jgi:spermidine synthase
MAGLKVTEHGGGISFYINGSLQFDTRDEAVYHESLALPAAALAAARLRRPLKALVLGGGDGLALREVLRAAPVEAADLVDYDEEVLALGRGAFAPYNAGALADPRVTVNCADASQFLAAARRAYDLIIADFTFPGDLPGCALFTREFFGLVRSRLSARGLLAVNAVSPEKFPAAYWAVYKTLRSAGFCPKPLSAAIPSFSAHGYGKWGFFFASPRAITPRELAGLRLPESASYLDRTRLRAAMNFDRSSVLFGAGLARPLRNPAELLGLLHLPPPAPDGSAMLDFFSRRNGSLPACGFPSDPALWGAETLAHWEDRLRALLDAFDWDALLSEAGLLSSELGRRLKLELEELKADFTPVLSGADGADKLYRTLAALAVLLIVINMAYPDNAFAKGYYGGSGGGDADIVLLSSKPASMFHGPAFQYLDSNRGLATDFAGKMYPALTLQVNDRQGAQPARTVRPFYSVSSEVQLTADGTAYMLLPAPYVLKLGRETFTLMKDKEPGELFRFRADPEALGTLYSNIQLQQKALAKAVADHRKWLAWAGPAGALLSDVRGDSRELANMQAIEAALNAALPAQGAVAAGTSALAGYLKICPGIYVEAVTGGVVFLREDGALVACPMPGLPPVKGLEKLSPTPEVAAFVRALLVARAKTLPESNPARWLGQLNDDDYQKFITLQ